MKRPIPRALAAAALLVALCPARGAAQQPAQGQQPAQPFQGLFGGSLTERPTFTEPRALDFNASVYGGYDDSLAVEDDAGSATGGSGNVGAVAILAGYRQGRKVDIGASGAAAARYYPDYTENGLTTSYFSASFGIEARLSQRTRVAFNQTGAYTPYQLWSLHHLSSPFSPVPAGQLPYMDLNQVASGNEAVTASTYALLQHQVSRRNFVGLVYMLNHSNFLGEQTIESAPDLTDQSLQGTYRVGVGRYAELDFGVGYQRGAYNSGPGATRVYEGYIFNVGINYGRSFGAAQRTTLLVSTGASGYGDDLGSNYIGTGRIVFLYLFSPRWQFETVYDRDVGFTAGLYEPTTSDSFSASITGLATQRLRLDLYAVYTSGAVGFRAPENNFDNVVAAATVQYALGRNVALMGQYSYYGYDFGRGVDLAPGVVYVTRRQGVRGGLSFWWPLAR